MSEVKRLEQEYGFNTEVALEVDPDLLVTDGETSPSLAYWTMLYEGIAASPRYTAFARSRVRSWSGAEIEEHSLDWACICVYKALEPSSIKFVKGSGDERAKIVVDEPHQRFKFNGSLSMERAEITFIIAITEEKKSEAELASGARAHSLEKPSTVFGNTPEVAMKSLKNTIQVERFTTGSGLSLLAGGIYNWGNDEYLKIHGAM